MCYKRQEKLIQAADLINKKPGYAWAQAGSGQMKLGLQTPTSINWGFKDHNSINLCSHQQVGEDEDMDLEIAP